MADQLGRRPTRRVFAPRLSIQTEYVPCPRTTAVGTIPRAICEPTAVPSVPRPDVLRLAALAAHRMHGAANADVLHTAALIDLAWTRGAGNSLDRSVSYLRMASGLATHPASLLTDLSAALMVRAAATNNPRDLLQAIDAGERAVDADPFDRPARYNVALGLDWLGVDGEAARAWSAYLSLDSTSGWAADARGRRRALAPSVPAAHTLDDTSSSGLVAFATASPQDALQRGWDHVLGAWGSAVERGDSARARTLLRQAQVLGETIEGYGGDRSLADAVRIIRRRSGSPSARRALATAHRAYAAARVAYVDLRYALADTLFERARRVPAAPSPLRRWLDVYSGATAVYQKRPVEGERRVRDAIGATDPVRYPALAGRARWVLGTTVLRSGRAEEAVAHYQDARRLFARAGELENVGAMHALEADARFSLGDDARAYAELYETLGALRPYRASVWLHNTLYVGAQHVANDGSRWTALRLAAEDVAVADRIRRPEYAIEARLARARLELNSSDGARVAADVDTARRMLPLVPDSMVAGWMRADAMVVGATAAMSTRPRQAAIALDSVERFFAGLHNTLRELPARVARAQARMAVGDTSGAASDLDTAAMTLDAERERIADLPTRAAFLQSVRTVFDQLAMSRVAAGQPARALEYVERARLSIAPVGASRGPIGRERPRAPDGAVVLDYALIGDTLLIWSITDTVVRLTRRTIDQAALTRTIAGVRAALELGADASAMRTELGVLYDVLVRPAVAPLDGNHRALIIVADDMLASVPFAALYDGSARQYLIERYALRFEFSVRDATTPTVASWVSEAPQRALVVADPAFDPLAYPGLARLPWAMREADSVAMSYEHPVMLGGAAADRAAVVRALAVATVVHFAGHAVFDDDQPERSRLVLAHAGLTADRIVHLDLRHVRLVVLSACETLRAGPAGAGGFAGLAGAFLAAGTGGVVGSLWRVDDALTVHVMSAFHQAYRAHGDGSAALREAQLRLLHSSDPTLRSPSVWAGFRYVGH